MNRMLFFKQQLQILMLLLAFSSVFFVSNTYGNQTVKLSELHKNGSVSLSDRTTYLVDHSNELQIKNILSKEHPMQDIETDVINFGFVSESY